MQAATSIAVVGAGLIGRRHIEIAGRLARLAAVVDPAPTGQEVAKNAGAVWFADLETCLTELPVQGVIIATPNGLHVAQARRCIAAGIPVLIEKPIADRSDAAAVLVKEASCAGVPVLVGHHRRHNPLIKQAKTVIEAGRLGRIVAVNAQFWIYKPDDYFDVDWRRSKGAGPVFINLIHDIDLLRHLCGDIVRVQAVESHTARGFEVEDTAAILLTFANGAIGTLTASDSIVAPWSWEFAAAENPAYPHVATQCYTIGGTHGSLSIPDLTLWSQPDGRGWWQPIEMASLAHKDADPLDLQFRHFLDVIAGRRPLVTGEDGLEALRVVEAIKTAARTGQAVELV